MIYVKNWLYKAVKMSKGHWHMMFVISQLNTASTGLTSSGAFKAEYLNIYI